MDLYNRVSYQLSRQLTRQYSTSFGMSSRLFSRELRPHIYAIYGLVRIADEVVDTYRGDGSLDILNRLESEVGRSLDGGYSTNPIIQAYTTTARRYNIESDLLAAFFDSMRIDGEGNYTAELYDRYIYGSAEVVGLMCLKVFTADDQLYDDLASSARALGRAYQKVNFLRDIRADYEQLGRVYFPDVDYHSLSAEDVQRIVADIKQDFDQATVGVNRLPDEARRAVVASALYYGQLLKQLASADVEAIKNNRLRVPNLHKLSLLLRAAVWGRL